MDSILRDPALQATVPPLLAALVLTGIFRGVGGAGLGARIAGASVGLGFLVGYYFILGIPPLPPATSTHRIFYVAAVGAGAGLLLDVWAAPPAIVRATAAILPAFGVAWLGQRGLTSGDWPTMAAVEVIAAAAFASLPRLAAVGVSTAEGAAMLVVAAAALSGVAILGASASLGQLAAALAAAAGGFALWNWPKSRYPFGAAAALGGGGTLVAIAGAMVLFTDAHPLAVALVLPVFFVAPIAHSVPVGQGVMAVLLRPLTVGAIAAIPALAAVGVAVLLTDNGSYP